MRTPLTIVAAVLAVASCAEPNRSGFEYVLIINNPIATAEVVSDKGSVEQATTEQPAQATVTVAYPTYEAAITDQVTVSIHDGETLDEHVFTPRACDELCTDGVCDIGRIVLQEHMLAIDMNGEFILPPSCWRCLGTVLEVGSCF